MENRNIIEKRFLEPMLEIELLDVILNHFFQ